MIFWIFWKDHWRSANTCIQGTPSICTCCIEEASLQKYWKKSSKQFGWENDFFGFLESATAVWPKCLKMANTCIQKVFFICTWLAKMAQNGQHVHTEGTPHLHVFWKMANTYIKEVVAVCRSCLYYVWKAKLKIMFRNLKFFGFWFTKIQHFFLPFYFLFHLTQLAGHATFRQPLRNTLKHPRQPTRAYRKYFPYARVQKNTRHAHSHIVNSI